MVSTSNCPPLVAISVVTRWRRTFSSSVTHFTVTSGFLAVNSPDNACMRIMSGLFTVAMVSVVCAIEGAEPNRVTAPSRAPRTCFTVTSLFLALSICPRLAIMFTPSLDVVKDYMGSVHCVAGAKGSSKNGSTRRGFALPARLRRKSRSDLLLLEDGACRRLLGNAPGAYAARQRRPAPRDLGGAARRSDGQGFGRNPRRNAGETAVCPAIDNVALGVERPARQLADGAEPHHFEQFLARDDAG